MNRKHLILLALSLWAASAAQAACPSTDSASRFSFNAVGDEVTDSKTGLVWARCSVGQAWVSGTCTGSASLHTHQQALQLAQGATGWRLPNVKELSSIADKGCQNPAIDGTAFPNTPNALYWSSTPFVDYAGYTWGLYSSDGGVNYVSRYVDTHAVRLVRASQ